MFDVIICGAGPAGSSLAYFLAKNNIDVLLLDKFRFPRYKPCAGAFPVEMETFFDFPLKKVIEKTYSSMLFRKEEREFRLQLGFPLAYLVNRKHFDNLLIEKAIEKGCIFKDGTEVLKIKGERIITNSEEFRGTIIVGAGGGSSIVRRDGKRFKKIGMWLKTISADIPYQGFKDIIFDFSYTKSGYAWIFPKRDELSVGLGAPPCHLRDAGITFEKLLVDYAIPLPETIHRFTYPTFSSRELLTWENTLLIGDAASLSDPSTGGGIYNAIRSAYLASKAIQLHLRKGIPLLYYQRLVNKYLYPKLTLSECLRRTFYSFPFTIQALRIGKPLLLKMTRPNPLKI